MWAQSHCRRKLRNKEGGWGISKFEIKIIIPKKKKRTVFFFLRVGEPRKNNFRLGHVGPHGGDWM